MTLQIESHVDISAAEADQARLEASLVSELNRLKDLRREAASMLEQARKQAEDPVLVANLNELRVPSLTVKAQQDEARMARLKALVVRKACFDKASAAVAKHTQELDQLLASIREEEQAAKARALQKPVPPPPAPPAEETEEADGLEATMIRALTKNDLKPVQRRAHERVSLCAEISLASDSNFFTGFTNDISEGGVFVATVNLLPIGTQIDLSFSLPGGPKIDGKGEVRWLREFDEKNPETFPGMGIRFLDIPAPSVTAIHAFAQHREPLFFPES